MKHLLLIFLLIFSIKANLVFAQTLNTIPNSFTIRGENLKSSDVDFYRKSILAADMEQFRLQTETVILKFKNGFTLELLSAKELVVKNIRSDVDISKYTNYPSQHDYKYPLFEILDSGWLVGVVDVITK